MKCNQVRSARTIEKLFDFLIRNQLADQLFELQLISTETHFLNIGRTQFSYKVSVENSGQVNSFEYQFDVH